MHIKQYTHAGWHWLGVSLGGRLHLLCKLGRVGDCVPLNGVPYNMRPYIAVDNAASVAAGHHAATEGRRLSAITSAPPAGDRDNAE